MTLFDLSGYNIRQLDPAQGTKPLDFGGGGITGSINLDGRFIAINTYHPEHGYIALTSIPPFPDEDRYDQKKVRAYRKSLVSNEGFGLQFDQEIIKREYFLIEDAVPFIRFTLADGTIAECITKEQGGTVSQLWMFSTDAVQLRTVGKLWFMRAAYTQLTEGGFSATPSYRTHIKEHLEYGFTVANKAFTAQDDYFGMRGFPAPQELVDGSINLASETFTVIESEYIIEVEAGYTNTHEPAFPVSSHFAVTGLGVYKQDSQSHIIVERATRYALLTNLRITDHMILPLHWNRDSYFVMRHLLNTLPETYIKREEPYNTFERNLIENYIRYVYQKLWRGTYYRSGEYTIEHAWARSYYANGMQKDRNALQLDQQIYPLLALTDYVRASQHIGIAIELLPKVIDVLKMFKRFTLGHSKVLIKTDETPADDDIPLPYHFSTHILLWHALKQLNKIYDWRNLSSADFPTGKWIREIPRQLREYFITEHKGKKIYAYATDGDGNFYLYHDANDIPLVMMPLWGFCEKDDEIWLNTIEFAFSDDNPGFYDGVLGSVHTPSAWALGDAQELIYCKVVGDRERYQRVWERVEKAAQWDGALPEAYDANTFEVVSRHWFAWPNAMVAIADSIPWNWEEEGEYAR